MNNNYLSEDELLEMANVTDVTTGIKDVVLWLGPQKNSRNKMIKVCNIPNKISRVDCFTIVLPKFVCSKIKIRQSYPFTRFPFRFMDRHHCLFDKKHVNRCRKFLYLRTIQCLAVFI